MMHTAVNCTSSNRGISKKHYENCSQIHDCTLAEPRALGRQRFEKQGRAYVIANQLLAVPMCTQNCLMPCFPSRGARGHKQLKYLFFLTKAQLFHPQFVFETHGWGKVRLLFSAKNGFILIPVASFTSRLRNNNLEEIT